MHNPYKAKLAVMAVSFVSVGSLAGCNNNPANVGSGDMKSSVAVVSGAAKEVASEQTSVPVRGPEGEVSVNPAPPPGLPEPEPEPDTGPEPEVSVNPAPPPGLPE